MVSRSVLVVAMAVAVMSWLVPPVEGQAAAPVRAQPPQQSPPCEAGDPCCRPALAGFVRQCRRDQIPKLVERFEPDLADVAQPYPSGVAILELGIAGDGSVVSSCVLRGVRPDYDKAAQTVTRRWRFSTSSADGAPAGFVMTVAVASPDPAELAPTVRYVKASVDEVGFLKIVTGDGRVITVTPHPDEAGFEQIAISPDGHAVGWVPLQENCCTSYPIPTRLVVHSRGTRRMYRGEELPVWKWAFQDEGRLVAFRQETVHGGLGIHYELHDVESGHLVAEWHPDIDPDGRARENQDPPGWVRELDDQPSALRR